MNYTFQRVGPKPVAKPTVASPHPNTIPIHELEILLLRENLREYSKIVDDIVRRAKEQEGIVKEWDREIERQRDMQYKLMFDDVIREIQFLEYSCKVYNGPLQI
jgi:hypothetical protein